MNENTNTHGATAGCGSRIFVALALACAVTLSAPAAYSQEAHGNLAAAIRESGNPCAHVIETEQTGNNTYQVRCNSGTFNVTIKDDGSAEVTAAD